MSPLTLDRAIAKILASPGSRTRAALLANGAANETAIYRMKTGLKPAVWPHVTYAKIPAGVRRSHAGVPRLVGDIVRIVATVRSDTLVAGKTALEVLEPIAVAILEDLADSSHVEVSSGEVWKSHITDPRYERDYAAGESASVQIVEMGVEAQFLSS